MKLATWNINSLKVRMTHLVDWLGTHSPDVVCLQETKLPDDKFPAMELEAAGYRSTYAGQKTYNGVAVLLRPDAQSSDVQVNMPNFEDDQKRLLALTLHAGKPNELRIVCAYFPNGQAVGSEKFAYKLRWLQALAEWMRDQVERYPRLALLGDYNIAPEDRDVHDPNLWEGQVMCSEPERAAFRGLLDLGLKDSFRLFEQPERSYTWWDYRQLAFRRKMGLRIDHILLTAPLASTCSACTIDVEPRRREQPSDHAPVLATIG